MEKQRPESPPHTAPRSTSTTEPAPRRASWKAMLVPNRPAPTTTTSAFSPIGFRLAGPSSANDQNVAGGLLDDLRAHGAHQQALRRSQPARPDDDEVRAPLPGDLDAHVGGLAFALDRVNGDALGFQMGGGRPAGLLRSPEPGLCSG